MKVLPEHIKDVDSFYKAKSEDDFMPVLPENLWDEIVLQIPSSPLPVSNPTTRSISKEKGATGSKGINFYHGALFYAAGLLSAVLLYTAYIHLTHQEDAATLQVTLPSLNQIQTADSASATVSVTHDTTTGKRSANIPANGQKETQSSNMRTTKMEEGVVNLKEGRKEETTSSNPSEVPTSASRPQVSQTSEQTEKLESTEENATVPSVHQEEHADFYHKHSKKAKDSLSKQLFIPKK